MTAPSRFIPHGIMPRPRSLLSGPDGKPPTWSERLDALKYVPPLLKLVYQTHRGYTVAIIALRVVRAVIPVGLLWIGKLIIEAIDDGIQAPIDQALEIERRAFEKVLKTEDAGEGIQAFFQKRPAQFKGK